MSSNRIGIDVPSGKIQREQIFDRNLGEHPQHRGINATGSNQRALLSGHYVAMVMLEDHLAYGAYYQELGIASPFPIVNRPDAIAQLNEEYVFFGISAGINQTELLIRDIEKAAKDKASEVAGPTR